jgi:hypothetical protein
MGRHSYKKCGILGHKDITCGLVDSSLTGKARNDALSALWGRNNRSKRAIATKEYRLRNPDRKKDSAHRSSEKLRNEIMAHYGGACACCGFNDLTKKLHGKSFLNIDHIEGNGRQHMRANKIYNLYQWLKQNKFPEGFRVLCRGCNNSIEPNDSHCILHKKEIKC